MGASLASGECGRDVRRQVSRVQRDAVQVCEPDGWRACAAEQYPEGKALPVRGPPHSPGQPEGDGERAGPERVRTLTFEDSGQRVRKRRRGADNDREVI